MNSFVSDIDRRHIWHPFTQEKIENLPTLIVRGQGSYLYDDHGKGYLDLISSWWVNLHGHSHPSISQAIFKQAQTLDHVLFAGFTHEPAAQLVSSLCQRLPSDLAKFFFSDNGSTAVEVAMKMAYQFWHNTGHTRRKLFLSFEGGYHGDTLGAMSVGKTSGFYVPFQDLLIDVLAIPYPHTWDGDDQVFEKETNALHVLEDILEKHGEQVAAIIVEPLVQGASGMRMIRAPFLKKCLEKVRSYGIFVIFDEVMTGFGRTGTLFALEQVGFIPDMLCLSKGLTGGILPLALTITTNKIYEAFLGDTFQKAFAHGHSYTAHPLGCAAGVASLSLMTNAVFQHISAIETMHKRCLKALQNTFPSVVKAPRILGDIAAFNLGSTEAIYAHSMVKSLKQLFWNRGLLLRPLGNTVYLMPPYSIQLDELENAYEKIHEIISCNLKDF